MGNKNLTVEAPEKLIQFIIDILKKTETELSKEKTSSDILSSVGRDIKLKADLICETYILKALRENTHYPILSEETGWQGQDGTSSRAGLHWVVDPIDGTYNYLRKIPISCMSVGLWDGDRPILGVVNDFMNSRCYYGIVGLGAWLDGEVIQISEISHLKEAVISTSLPTNYGIEHPDMSDFFNKIAQFKKVRMFGASALSLALVANGNLDFHYEEETMYWDVAAGIPIILGANGHVEFQFTQNMNRIKVKAGNKKLLKQFNEIQ